jgi:hypothetical protein
MSIRALIISAAVAMTASTAANSAQLVKNGGFEDGNFTGWVTRSTLPDQVVTGPLTPYSGTYYADVGGGSGSTRPFAALAQVIKVAAPGVDTLTYELNLGGTTAPDLFFARWDNKLIKGSLVKGAAGSVDDWVTYTFTVDALGGGKDRLTFDFRTPNGNSPWALDQVSLTGPGVMGSATPEPAAWALMLTGMGGLGFALRRRRERAPALV